MNAYLVVILTKDAKDRHRAMAIISTRDTLVDDIVISESVMETLDETFQRNMIRADVAKFDDNTLQKLALIAKEKGLI